MTCTTRTPGLQAPLRQIGSREECETLGRGKKKKKKKQLDIWRLLPPSLLCEVGAGKLQTEGDRWSDGERQCGRGVGAERAAGVQTCHF